MFCPHLKYWLKAGTLWPFQWFIFLCSVCFNVQQLSLNVALTLCASQVPGPRAAVLVPGLPTHPVRLYSRPGAQAAAFLPQLHRDHAQRRRGRQAGDPGVPAPVQGPPMELHHHQGQPGHFWPSAGQR